MEAGAMPVATRGGSAVALESEDVLGLAVEQFVHVAGARLDGVMVDAQIEGLTADEAVCRLLLLTSLELRKVALDADYGRVPNDDHH